MLLISGALITLLVAQTPTDEEVRRIVEKSMAAVELAEAKATRDIAEMRIRLSECDSELTKARGDNNVLLGEKAALQTTARQYQQEAGQARAAAQAAAGDVALLEAELIRAKAMLAETDSAAQAARADRKAYSDSIQAIEAQMRRATIERSEALERVEAYQTRAALLEESLKAETARAAAAVDVEAGPEKDELLRENAEMKERVLAYQNRTKVIEEALRAELAKVVEREAQVIADRTKVLSDSLAQSSNGLREITIQRDKALADFDEVNRALRSREAELGVVRAERENAVEQLKAVTLQRDAIVPSDTLEVAALRKEIAALRELLAAPRPADLPVAVSAPVPVPVPAPIELPRSAVSGFDFNKASADELAAIPAIGPTRAKAIVWYRENVAAINSEEDLKSVPGFNDERIKALKEYLTEVSR